VSGPHVAAYGTWRSPLSASDAASGATRFSGLAVEPAAGSDDHRRDEHGRDEQGGAGDGAVTVWWAESRPAEGRVTIMGARGDEGAVEAGPGDLRVRSRVNEYGGGAIWAAPDALFWVDESSQCIHRQTVGPATSSAVGPIWRPRTLTVPPPAPRSWRYAAGRVSPAGDWVVVEREAHADELGLAFAEPRNELVAVRVADGRQWVLVGIDPADADPAGIDPADVDGAEVAIGSGDFVAAPALGPDGTSLAWLRWDHPDMPWDAAELWVGELDLRGASPRLSQRRRIAGGRAGGAAHGLERPVSVCLPEWSPDGRLWWCDDADGWWHLRAAHDLGTPDEGAGDDPSTAVPGGGRSGEEVGEPRWVAGGRRYAFLGDGRIAMIVSADGVDSIHLLDPATGQRSPLPGPAFCSAELIAAHGSTVAIVGGTPTSPTSVWRLDLADDAAIDLRPTAAPLDPAWISVPEPVSFPTGAAALPGAPAPDGHGGTPPVAHALLYPPTSGDHRGPDGELPPLVVRIHGGPTAAARPEFSTSVQFWTTRGFAVADVNYRGSTGFGRAYRDLLQGSWGVVDVEDCLAVTGFLAASGRIDGERCVIRGGSAGGFTALAALCFQTSWGAEGAFAAACSLYGVTDLAAMVADTHKFESRYLDGLVAPLPEGEAVYRERSPLFHAERIDRPVLLLQGSADVVVPPSQAEVLVAALEARGVPHRYVLFPGEGHGFHLASTVVQALRLELDFYGEVLGFDPAPDGPG
jgi:dipeptidyl aminopeptidase/acylaminoacyl peptidase